jgi:hypothetical protein
MALVPAVLLACALSLACGGGGGGAPAPPPSLTATFNPLNNNPGPMTLNMGRGASGGTAFSVLVQVTDISNFHGAAFRVNFDPATAEFTGFTSTGSFLLGAGQTQFDAVVQVPGEVIADATLLGGDGIDANGTNLLMTLNFRATAATGGNNFNFGIAANREVQICPPAQACSFINDAQLVWSGGTMTAN